MFVLYISAVLYCIVLIALVENSVAAINPIENCNTTASKSNHPYFAQILYDGQLVCGGSVVNKKHVLTSAQCFVRRTNLTNYLVRVGSKSSIHNEGGKEFKIEQFIVHPNYDNFTDFDVAVILVNGSMHGHHIRHIKLSQANRKELIGKTATVIGYGRVGSKEPFSQTLQEAELQVIEQDRCVEKMAPVRVTNQMICAADPEGLSATTCIGDSGGPLVVNKKLVGVVSAAIGCATKGKYGVYTFVPMVKHWIKHEIKIIYVDE